MKPDWDKLMNEFADHTTILVGDVDCTAAGQSLCNEIGVRGYPTIKSGDPSNLEDYKGGRDFASLKKFAEGLKPACSPANIDLCDATQKNKIEEIQALSASDLDAKIKEKEQEQAAAEKTFDDEVSKLQKKYEELQKQKETQIEAVKESGLGLMKAVKAHAASSKGEL